MFNMRTIVYDTSLTVDSRTYPKVSQVDQQINPKDSKEKSKDTLPPEIVLFHGGCVA